MGLAYLLVVTTGRVAQRAVVLLCRVHVSIQGCDDLAAVSIGQRCIAGAAAHGYGYECGDQTYSREDQLTFKAPIRVVPSAVNTATDVPLRDLLRSAAAGDTGSVPVRSALRM